MIGGLGSLRLRLFLAGTLLATASIGSAVYLVSALLTAQAEQELRRDLTEAANLVDRQSASLFDGVTRTATLIADLPKLKAAIETQDPPTIAPIARDYLAQSGADVLVVLGRDARRLAAVSSPTHAVDPDEAPALPVSGGGPGSTFWPHERGVLQVVTVPVTIGLASPEVLGTLVLGYLLDSPRATDLRTLSGADVVFVFSGRVRASSLPADATAPIAEWLAVTPRPAVLRLGDEEYSGLVRPLERGAGGASVGVGDVPQAIVFHSRSERMRTLGTIRTALGGVALGTVALAAIFSYALARSVTTPLATIAATMREAAATGDLSRKVVLPDSAWTDEDARLVASTFNALTDSVAAAQRDAAQRERLSALGRLSTVIAHEIRNPLMIIKGALRQLSRPGAPDDTREAAHDINEEVNRLNRVVNEVLDFARPIRFELAPAAVNDVCRSARDAVLAAAASPDIGLDLDADAGELMTDAERVRTVLVNLLTNARAAVEGAAPAGSGPFVVLATRRHGRDVEIAVRDRGAGIPADDLPRIFDPYFTTRRTGSGLGLPIAKNVVEGLGGTISVGSRVGVGTEIVVRLGDTERRAS